MYAFGAVDMLVCHDCMQRVPQLDHGCRGLLGDLVAAPPPPPPPVPERRQLKSPVRPEAHIRVLRPHLAPSLATRTLRILWRGGYRTVESVIRAADEDLTDLPSFGPYRLEITRQAVRDYYTLGVEMTGGRVDYSPRSPSAQKVPYAP
jgi:hypothetical protein